MEDAIALRDAFRSSAGVPQALAAYAEAREVLGDLRLVDLVGMIGYYTLISLTINIFDIPPMGDAPERDLPDDKA